MGRLSRLITATILTAMLVLSVAAPSRAAAKRLIPDYEAPVNLLDTVLALVEARRSELVSKLIADINYKPESPDDKSYLLEAMMANRWIVTRSVINGMGDLSKTVDYIGTQ